MFFQYNGNHSPFAAEDWNWDGDFIARVLAVSEDGLCIDVAASEFAATDEDMLKNIGALFTKVRLLKIADEEGHPVFRSGVFPLSTDKQ